MSNSKGTLPKSLKGHPFRYADANGAGLSQYTLKKMLKAGIVVRLRQGLYEEAANESTEERDFESATIYLGKPSAICLISALSYYGLTDQIAKKTWIMVPANKRTIHKDLKVIRVLTPHWDIGILQGASYWITSLERTLVDCIVYQKKIGLPVALAAIKQAINQKKTTLAKVAKIADDLGSFSRIKRIIEVLA
jgi:predicted transcriptional regulator of viral defense system